MSKKKFNENTNLNLYDVSKDIISFWKKNKIFEKSIENRKDSKVFSFYEGPPSANGLPGIHHVMARTVKDVFCRYKTIKGFKVNRKAGWDTHGLPVELGVEKELLDCYYCLERRCFPRSPESQNQKTRKQIQNNINNRTKTCNTNQIQTS